MSFFNILCAAPAEFLGTSRLFLAKMIHCSLAFSFRRILYATVAHLRDFYKDCVGGRYKDADEVSWVLNLWSVSARPGDVRAATFYSILINSEKVHQQEKFLDAPRGMRETI